MLGLWIDDGRSAFFQRLYRVLEFPRNIILFIPIGVFGPLLNTRLFKKLPFVVSTLSLLIAIETIQYAFRVGSFDIDDIILNTAGAVIGFAIMILFERLTYRNPKMEKAGAALETGKR